MIGNKIRDFESVLEEQKRIFCRRSTKDKPENNSFAFQKANKIFSLSVLNPLFDSFTAMASLQGFLKNQQAIFYISHGVARRLRMIWYAYRNIILTAPVDRKKPLNGDEGQELTRDINIIYMNISGTLDNYTWALLHEKAPDLAKSILRKSVYLFSPKILKHKSFVSVRNEILQHEDWNKEVKELRDPVAHRIPLYIPPAVLSAKETQKYIENWDAALTAISGGATETAEERMGNMDEIGTFLPYFLHHPEEKISPIYPTVPKDIGHLIEISQTIGAFMRKH